MAATKAIELYDQIIAMYEQLGAMCGDHKGMPAPFDSIYATLLTHRFNLERLKQV